MTKQEAIDFLEKISDEYILGIENPFDIAIKCIEHCIEEEESPCYECYKDNCDICIHSGKII